MNEDVDYLEQLNSLNLKDTLGKTSMKTLDDILKEISEVKLKYRQVLEAKKPPAQYCPPGGWKNCELRPVARSRLLEQAALLKKSKSHTIDRFRSLDPKWDRSITLELGLKNALYRTPGALS